MKTQNSEIEDAVYQLKVAMRQVQSDLEKQSKKIIELENKIKRLKIDEHSQNKSRTVFRGNTRR